MAGITGGREGNDMKDQSDESGCHTASTQDTMLVSSSILATSVASSAKEYAGTVEEMFQIGQGGALGEETENSVEDRSITEGSMTDKLQTDEDERTAHETDGTDGDKRGTSTRQMKHRQILPAIR